MVVICPDYDVIDIHSPIKISLVASFISGAIGIGMALN